MPARGEDSVENAADALAADRFTLAVTIGLIAGMGIVGVGFWVRPAGSGVWYGFAVVMTALILGTVLTISLGYGDHST